MILEKQNFLNIKKIKNELSLFIGPENAEDLSKLASVYQLCHAGSNEVGTKLDNLDSEFSMKHDHNPIHHMESRMKAPQSLFNKLDRRGFSLTLKNVEEHIYDIGGIRVITNYIDDVYRIEELLLNQSDVTLIERKDYIKKPKDSGYRSLHLVISVPVFQSDGVFDVPVEVQIRTVGMDMWASLEHKLRYKSDMDPKLVDQHAKELQDYASELNTIEENMQVIFHDLQHQKQP